MEGLTLVPLGHAKLGARFTFMGANPGDECDGCPLQRLCFGLQPGQRYRVAEVRAAVHPCNLHDDGKVQVVRVEPIAFESSVETKRLRGTAVTWSPIDCGFAECANWKLCHPIGPAAGAKYRVEGDGEALPCPMHYDLRKVRLQA